MLDREKIIMQASETNVYDVMIRLIEARQNLAHYTMNLSNETNRAMAVEQIEKLDEHFFDLKCIATDYYDPEEKA